MQWRQLDLVAVVPRCCSNAPFLLHHVSVHFSIFFSCPGLAAYGREARFYVTGRCTLSLSYRSNSPLRQLPRSESTCPLTCARDGPAAAGGEQGGELREGDISQVHASVKWSGTLG